MFKVKRVKVMVATRTFTPKGTRYSFMRTSTDITKYWLFRIPDLTPYTINDYGTKNCCVTHVKIRKYANLVSSLLAYLISAVASWFSNSILCRLRMLLQIVFYSNISLFSIAGKF